MTLLFPDDCVISPPVVKPQMNSTSSSMSSSSSSLSPLKKLNYSNSNSSFNTISGKPTPHIVNPSFKDDSDVRKLDR